MIGLVAATIYRKLRRHADFAADAQASTAPLKESKRIVYVLAALFSLDAFGGGFIVQSMLALWMFEKFQLSVVMPCGDLSGPGCSPHCIYCGGASPRDSHFGIMEPDAPAFQRVKLEVDSADAGSVLGHRAAARSQRAVADGCADAKLVRHGGGVAVRACGGCQHHVRSAQPGVVDQPADCRLPAPDWHSIAALIGGIVKIVYDLTLSRAALRGPPAPEESNPPKG